MGRLIDADMFEKHIVGSAIVNNYSASKANILCNLIDAQPTAYEPDKVVEQLESLKTINVDVGFGTVVNTLRKDVVLEIVKVGGTDAEH